ncbi:MAG TPA: acetate/propionate family kinase [Myxococcales bacterium]|jgi:acetate kinase
MNVLCVNAGSSTLKLAAYDGERQIAKAQTADSLREALRALGPVEPQAVGHRLVHGGPRHHEPTLIDQPLIASLRSLIPFAPLHLPKALDAIEEAQRLFPQLPQVACFDTHFHWSLPERAKRLPLTQELHDEGVRRYGFHGLSYEFIVAKLGDNLGRRAVVAHLGNGASLAALDDGRCVDTTMAFTPAAGIIMGTRTGDLDPGVALYLLAKGLDLNALERLFERESGLRGISGVTSDMRELLHGRASDPRAALAVEMFALSCRKAIGAFAAVLGGLDTLVFTGGIGENAAEVRADICRGLGHLGLWLDDAANAAGTGRISTARSACTALVVPTDEDLVIARHTAALVGPSWR